MNCLLCGRAIKSEKSRELGYGPVCYKKVYGSSTKIRSSGKTNSSADELPYYEIPGQMCLEDLLEHEE